MDGDGYVDIVQIAYFANNIVWMKNPGKARRGHGRPRKSTAACRPNSRLLVDLDNDGKARELLPQFDRRRARPLVWYDLQGGKWVKHVVSTHELRARHRRG